MMLAAKVDEYGRGGWIAAMVLAFILWWPVGLAILAFLAFSGRLRRGWCNEMRGRWHNMGDGACGWGRGGRSRWGSGFGGGGGGGGRGPSGNQAFDDYRTETLRRLEEEQREFVGYLERLRRAKDKAEFDQFMAERRGGRPVSYPPGDTV